MGRKSRMKGKRGEREAAEALRDLFPDVRRTAMQARGGGEQPDLANTPGWWIEVGVGNVNPRAKWEQAAKDTFQGCEEVDEDARRVSVWERQVPIAITKRDRGEWLVTMSLSDWKRLVRDAAAHRESADAVRRIMEMPDDEFGVGGKRKDAG